MGQLALILLIAAIAATLLFNLLFAIFPTLTGRIERRIATMVKPQDGQSALTLPRLFPIQTSLSILLVLFILFNLGVIIVA
ncbi:hypothetical protein ACFFUB_03575 [Algimonas porphyrae]|uniref:Uncharacterized protein n=1 Tax=Algimonas porphyrae TaxID=1128113 RepID=A0ABQ5UZ19_9PROT|nr:hypothetical protein [Algimonas porphyrae]GLQ20154.1 hypothetical protein GCM10007854_11090 [Algimonas porphyrae]